SKTSPLVDDDLDEEEATKVTEKKNLENDIVDEALEIDEIVNIKESRNHPLKNVIGNINQRTLRSQAQNQSNFFCFISTTEPKNVNEALGDESWIVVIQEELNQFINNDVWELVRQPKNMTIKRTKWVFRNKLDKNGVVSRNKARLVAQGYNQQEGIDYDETYVPVARLEFIRILLAYACALDFKLFQMDVKSAFLNGFIMRWILRWQSSGFIDFQKLDHVYKLKKALYGLKQAPKACQFHLSYNDDGEIFVEFMFQDQYYSFFLEEFAAILGVPCEEPELQNPSYVLYDHVMEPLSSSQERKPRRDHGTRRGRPSTFDHPSSSHHNDDDGNDEGTSRASTPSPICYVNSLTNQIPQVFQNPPNIEPHLEPFYTRQTKIMNRQIQLRDEQCGGVRSIKKSLRRLWRSVKK
ncbi:retrovirus-related pol polyprotein from transposon TNT 1-94, partial [Tanacetum coccineum]